MSCRLDAYLVVELDGTITIRRRIEHKVGRASIIDSHERKPFIEYRGSGNASKRIEVRQKEVVTVSTCVGYCSRHHCHRATSAVAEGNHRGSFQNWVLGKREISNDRIIIDGAIQFDPGEVDPVIGIFLAVAPFNNRPAEAKVIRSHRCKRGRPHFSKIAYDSHACAVARHETMACREYEISGDEHARAISHGGLRRETYIWAEIVVILPASPIQYDPPVDHPQRVSIYQRDRPLRNQIPKRGVVDVIVLFPIISTVNDGLAARHISLNDFR
ncbi:MAG TPA: hypothetical protein VFH68_26285 [Polyangia bacterium]|jgi:hypothetical protein|nr:hypothetical protein [Polyangia bacterium]